MAHEKSATDRIMTNMEFDSKTRPMTKKGLLMRTMAS